MRTELSGAVTFDRLCRLMRQRPYNGVRNDGVWGWRLMRLKKRQERPLWLNRMTSQCGDNGDAK